MSEAGGLPPPQQECVKLYQVVTPEHFQVMREAVIQSAARAPDRRAAELWVNQLLPAEDALWQLLEQLTHAKHQLTTTRWRTHDAMLRSAMKCTLDLAISEAQCAEFMATGRPPFSSSSSSSPTRRTRTQIAQDNKEVFESWRQRMQTTESGIKSVRDQWARLMNQRTLALLEAFGGRPEVAEDIASRLTAADSIVKNKCMVDGEDSQSDQEDEPDVSAVVVARQQQQQQKSARRPSARQQALPARRRRPSPATAAPPQPQSNLDDRTVHLEMTLDSRR